MERYIIKKKLNSIIFGIEGKLNINDNQILDFEEYNILLHNEEYISFDYFDGLFFSIKYNIILKNNNIVNMNDFGDKLKEEFIFKCKEFLYFYAGNDIRNVYISDYKKYNKIYMIDIKILTKMTINDMIQILEDICLEYNDFTEENKYYMSEFIHNYKNYNYLRN